MLSPGRTDFWAATLLATFLLEVAASPSPYAGFSVDDVRRPVYRGNTRYKRHLLNYLLQADNGANESSSSFSRNMNRNLPSFSELPWNAGRQRRDVSGRGGSKAEAEDSLENETWALILQSPSITESNHTKNLVHNFLKSSLKVLKSPSQDDLKLRSVETTPSPESLDKLIISHTRGQRPIQMYPEGSPPSWSSKPVDPNVILIEDVHPSKLPKPQNWEGNRPGHWPSPWYKPEENNHYGAVKPTYETDPWDKPTDSHYGAEYPTYKPDPWGQPTDHNHHETSQPVYKPDLYNPSSILLSSHRPKPQPDNIRPPIILIEDVSPSKLPLPDNQWGSQSTPHYELLTTTSRPGKPGVVIRPKPTQQSPNPAYQPVTLRPKPTRPTLVKPITQNYSDLPGLIDKPVSIKPQVVHPKPITVKPVFLHPKPLKPVKRPNRPVSTGTTSSDEIIRPAVLHDIEVTTLTGFTSSKPSSVSVTFHKPVQSPTTRPKPTVQYKPIYSSYPTSGTLGGPRPDYRPVQLYPNPGPSPEPPPKPHVPIHPPLNASPRPPEAPYRDPPVKPNKPLGSAIIFTQTTLPPLTVPSRPPPPSIVILEAEPEEPPIVEDCGTVHIINDVKAQKACSDVMILLNSPLAVANSAAAGGAGGGSAAAAAAAGAGAAAAVGAGAAAGVGAAAAGAAAAAAAGAASAGIGQAAGSGPSSTGGSASAPMNPILPPLQDETSSGEDYDYEDVSTPPSTTSPPSISMTLYEYITSFASALPYVGPFGVAMGILILGPLGFMILTALGVGILVFPWILPRIIFGRRRRRSLLYKPQLSDTASLFLHNLNSGYFDQYRD